MQHFHLDERELEIVAVDHIVLHAQAAIVGHAGFELGGCPFAVPEIDFQNQYYYARPKSMEVKPKSLDEVDPKLLATYEKLASRSRSR